MRLLLGDIQEYMLLRRVFHAIVVGGHSGVHATTKKMLSFCYYKGLEKM